MQHIRGRLWVAPAVLAGMLVLGACDHARTVTGVDTTAGFNFTNGPDTPGPIMVRVEGQLVFFFSADVEHNLLSMHFPKDVNFCGGPSPRNMADAQFITTPSGQVAALIQDEDGGVAIYGTSDLTEAFGPGGPFSDIPHLCAFLNGPKKLAEGIARRVSVFSGQSFSGTWTGTLTDVNGDPVQYSEHVAFHFHPQTGVRTVTASRINLQ